MDLNRDFIPQWRAAYRAANDTTVAPAIVERGRGWYVILDGSSRKVRRSQIEAMTERLKARALTPR